MPRGGYRPRKPVEAQVDRKELNLLGYKIYRFDAYNFALQKDAKIEYYPSVHSALVGLLHKKIDTGGDLSVQNILNRIELVERNIVNAINQNITL